jgi:hypothetical protein
LRNRRTERPRATAGAAAIAAAVGSRLWAKAARRPVDSLAIVGAVAASLVIVVNGVFLQSGPHPAPFFAVPTAPQPAASSHAATAIVPAPKAAEAVPVRMPAGPHAAQPVSARRNDPIADLIGSPSRVIAAQRILSEFGYGQIKATGVLDEPTSVAIERFEREHKLPLTGRLSERVLSGLAAMAGHPLD